MKCPLCEKKYQSLNQLNRHMKKIHEYHSVAEVNAVRDWVTMGMQRSKRIEGR